MAGTGWTGGGEMRGGGQCLGREPVCRRRQEPEDGKQGEISKKELAERGVWVLSQMEENQEQGRGEQGRSCGGGRWLGEAGRAPSGG